MSAIRDAQRKLRPLPGLALAVLGALLICGQIAGFAHADIDCGGDSCGFCSAPGSDSGLVGDAALPNTARCSSHVEPLESRNAIATRRPAAQLIRGPPET